MSICPPDTGADGLRLQLQWERLLVFWNHGRTNSGVRVLDLVASVALRVLDLAASERCVTCT